MSKNTLLKLPQQNNTLLKRQLGFWDSIAINVGIVIGVGIFRTPGEIAKYLNSSQAILWAWIVGGGVSLFGVFCYAELSSRHPHTGGTYVYLKEAFGKLWGFLFGWMEISVLRAGSIASVAYVFSDYLASFIPTLLGYEKFISIAAILFFSGFNLLGIHFSRYIQNSLSSLKVVTLLVLSAVIFFSSVSYQPMVIQPEVQSTQPFLILFLTALIPVLFSYGGWHESTFMSGEFNDTKRALPLSLVTSSLIVTVLYVTANAAYLKAIGPQGMAESKAIAAQIMDVIFGRTGKSVITAAILCSAAGALNSTILTGARIPFAVGGDYEKLSWLLRIHPKWQTPVLCVILNAVWSSALVLWGSFENLLFFCGFAKWLFFTLAGISVFRLRSKKNSTEAYQMFGYPIVPAIFTVTSLALCVISIIHAPKAAFLGSLLLLAGIPVYSFLKSSHVN